MFRDRKEVYKQMYEACESISHDCTSKMRLKLTKMTLFFDMKDLFIKKDIENEEIMREKKEKCSQQYESEL